MYRRTLALAFVSVLAPLSLALTQDAPRQSPNATKLPEVRLSAQRHLTPSCGGRAPTAERTVRNDDRVELDAETRN